MKNHPLCGWIVISLPKNDFINLFLHGHILPNGGFTPLREGGAQDEFFAKKLEEGLFFIGIGSIHKGKPHQFEDDNTFLNAVRCGIEVRR